MAPETHDIPRPLDPRDLGANCDACPLRDARQGPPVFGEHNPGAHAILVAEAPGETEVRLGRPLVGDSGRILTQAMAGVGWTRSSVSLTNAILCRPPNNELDIFLQKLKRTNERRIANGEEPLPTPMQCCRPRLMREVLPYPNLVALGKKAFQSITGKPARIFDVRGGPIRGTFLADSTAFLPWPVQHVQGVLVPVRPPDAVGFDVRLLPTLHPAFVSRVPKWTGHFRADIGRAYRWFTIGLSWTPPKSILNPPVDDLDRLLEECSFPLRTPSGAVHRAVSWDFETGPAEWADGREPMLSAIRVLGFGGPSMGFALHLLSVDGFTRYYTEHDLTRIERWIRHTLTRPDYLKVGWNSGYFDTLKARAAYGVTPSPHLDLILVHKSAAPELSHRLGDVASVHTDTPAWKSDHTATNAKDDPALGHYNVVDNVNQARLAQPLIDIVQSREQAQVVAKDMQLQAMCVGMKEQGLYINQSIRAKIEHDLRVQAEKHLIELTRLAGADGLKVAPKAKKKTDEPRFNPNSADQVRRLLYDVWNMPVHRETEKGEPSTGDEGLVAIICDPYTPKHVREWCVHLRKFREKVKLRGTYALKARRQDELYRLDRFADDEALKEEAAAAGLSDEEFLSLRDKERGGMVFVSDSRIHPDYSAHVVVSGRLSSSGWNAQNVPSGLRKMVEGQYDRWLVGVDADQLELRAITAKARIEKYLEVFRQDGDPHAMTAEMMFGSAFKHGSETERYELRRLAKTIKYASFYGAGDKRVHEIVVSAEDNEGNFINRKLTLTDLIAIRRRWFREIPELPRWWAATEAEYRRNGGFLVSPLWGRRRDFLNGEEYNEILNFQIQSGGAEIVHEITFKLLEEVPFAKWGHGTGLVEQGHDALVFEVPEDKRTWMRDLLHEGFRYTTPAFPDMPFKGKPKMGRNWKDLA